MMKLYMLFAFIILLSGCSLVQWLPSSACDYVEYKRVTSHVTVYAECDI